MRKHAKSVITWCNNSIILYDRQKKLMALGYGMQSRVKIQHSCVQAQLYRSHLCFVVEYGSNHIHFSWSGSIFCHLLQSNCIIKIEILYVQIRWPTYTNSQTLKLLFLTLFFCSICNSLIESMSFVKENLLLYKMMRVWIFCCNCRVIKKKYIFISLGTNL